MKSRIAIFAAVGITAFSAMADDLDKIKSKGEITIGVRQEAPPFSFYDKAAGTVTGYDVAFGQYIAKQLGVKPVFKPITAAERIPALKEGRIDIVIAALAKTPDREKTLEFSLGYFVAVQKFAAKPGRFNNLSQFNGAKICYAQGTTTDSWLADNLPKAIPISTSVYSVAFRTLTEGGCDAVAGPATILKGNLAKIPNSGLVVLDDIPLGVEIFAMGMRKGEKRLQKSVNEALIESEKTGEAVRIYEQYFGQHTAVPQLRVFKIQG
ncbi:transporter substrate-binding domain-containing protein [Chitinimonas sp. PSY-7]|uniref:transporter substrate-binding domain-containing protein n=1 Tax=Chitinimonas sp. PSY-7 TaxID=3459088 RepID=UPI00403FF11C